MSETLINIGTALVLLAVIGTFLRNRLSYLGRALAPCAVFVLEFLTWLAWGARLALHWFGYRVLLGRRDPPVKRLGVQAGADYVENDAPDEIDTSPVPGGTYQLEPGREPLIANHRVPFRIHRNDITILLANAIILDDAGTETRLSANKIAAAVPLERSEVLALVRDVREMPDPAPKPPPGPQFEQVGPNSFRRVEGT